MSSRIVELKSWFLYILLLISTSLFIILDIPIYRQIFGFIFLTIVPGTLIVRLFNFKNMESLEKILLIIGLSISFVLFFGFAINELLFIFGYNCPLSLGPILISFNIAYALLSIFGYIRHKGPLFSLNQFSLNRSEKMFLLIPPLFPAMSIFGMHLINETGNYILLLYLFLLIVVYLILICYFHQYLSKRIYPIILFLISISIVILLPLRSKHIIGTDSHNEYYFFITTLNNLHWCVLGSSTLNSCLTISLLPTVYHSIVGINPEFLFKILYSIFYSISPLVVYVISKKYVEELYAFLASIFFMSQALFIYAAANARTVIAILFFSLAIMVLFDDKIAFAKKKTLFILFLISCLVSHYSTSYIFFIILIFTYIGSKTLSYKYDFNKNISLVSIILFFTLIYYWYSLQTRSPFESMVHFLQNTILSLNDMFLQEARSSSVQTVLGENINKKTIAYKINFLSNWATIMLIGIGASELLLKNKETVEFGIHSAKTSFLKEKFSVEYFVAAIICIGILFSIIAVPHLTKGYEMSRIYGLTSVFLSLFFSIGGIALSKKLRLSAHFIILLILVPYFLASTGSNYAIFDTPKSIIFSSSGEQYDLLYIHEKETFASKWLKEKVHEEELKVYSDSRGRLVLTSQGILDFTKEALDIKSYHIGSGYVFLRYDAVVNKAFNTKDANYTIDEEQFDLNGKSIIYNDGCEIYI